MQLLVNKSRLVLFFVFTFLYGDERRSCWEERRIQNFQTMRKVINVCVRRPNGPLGLKIESKRKSPKKKKRRCTALSKESFG
jgi:hypothetical protein